MKENPYTPPSESEEERRGCSPVLKSLSITLARTVSYSAGAMSLVGFFFAQRQVKAMAGMLLACSATLAILAFVLCCVAASIHTRDELERRPLLLAMLCIAIPFSIFAFWLPRLG